MNSSTRPFALTGVALATVGALIATTPAAIGNAAVPTPEATPVTADIDLLSHSKGGGWKVKGDVYIGYFGAGSFDSDDDDDEYQGNGYSDDDDDEDDDDHDGWGGGGFGSFVTDFLANNQAEVIAVTAMIPVFNIGPVAVGNSLLANAYYDGYNGSATGVDGVVSYVTSQIGVPPADLVQGLVLARRPWFRGSTSARSRSAIHCWPPLTSVVTTVRPPGYPAWSPTSPASSEFRHRHPSPR